MIQYQTVMTTNRSKMIVFILYTSFVVLLKVGCASAFAPQPHDCMIQQKVVNVNTLQNTIISHKKMIGLPKLIENQRKSLSSVQTMSLFGLGVPELAVIAIAVFFVLGPQKIAEIGRGAGRAASDFKDIPKEFQKGLEEGETEARSRKAKPMEELEDMSE